MHDPVRDDETLLSAVVVRVPPVEAIVARHRERRDVLSQWGVPAHVTVLFPFVHPTRLSEEVFSMLADAVATVEAFDCSFTDTGWFGDEVVWLHPEPAEPFRALTDAVSAAFPGHPPYGGAFTDLVPHLTIGDSRYASPDLLRAAEAEVRPQLPVSVRVDEVVLIAGRDAPESWRTVRSFPLAPSTE